MKHIIAALLTFASLEVLAQPADEFHQVQLGARAVMACAHVDDCFLSSGHSSLTARQTFEHIAHGTGRDAFRATMTRVLDAAEKGDPEACKAALTVTEAQAFVAGVTVSPETRTYLRECCK